MKPRHETSAQLRIIVADRPGVTKVAEIDRIMNDRCPTLCWSPGFRFGSEYVASLALPALYATPLGTPTLGAVTPPISHAFLVILFLLVAGLVLSLLLQRHYRLKAVAMHLAQNRILEKIARGAPLEETLELLARLIESECPETFCSILLLEKDGLHVRHGAAPNLPEAYVNAINGAAIGPNVGSCGTAMFLKKRVIVRDIQTDPLWEDYRSLALAHQLRSCWSMPILARDGRVLGSFAMYHRRAQTPASAELRLLEIACHLASIAIEHCQAQQTLLESEQRFRSAIENLNEGLAITAVDGVILDVNPQMLELTGYQREEMIGHPAYDLIAPEHREEMLQRLKERRDGQSESYELLMRCRDGVRLWVQINASPLRDASGHITGTIAAYSNISLRKEAEEALRREEERFRLIALSTQDAIYDCDLRLGTVWRNEAYIARFGANEPLNPDLRWWRDRIHPDDREQVLASNEQALRERNFCWAAEYRLRKADGSYATVLDRGYFVYDPDGQPFRKLGAMTDITERKQAEAELFNSRQMLRTVIDTIPQRVFWKNRNLVYVGCNQPFAQDCGFKDPSELVGKTDFDTKSAEIAEVYRADDKRVMDTNQARINYEEPQIKANGAKGWLRASKVPLHDKDGNVIGVLGTYEDITDRRQLEEQLRQSQKMEAFGQLAGGVAHDFNNLLTIIQGNVSLMQIEAPANPDHAACLQDIARATERAANLTRQLLTFSRRQLFQPRPLDLNETVAQTTKMLQRLIGEHIGLGTLYAPGIAPVTADRNMMEQILVNLAVNSRDAMPKGGKLVIATAIVNVTELEAQADSKKKPGSFVRLSITDSGSGIAPEHMEHIFEPFFTTKEVGKGTGLGLATVFGIVTQHQGWIEVESQANCGTTFHIYLPRLVETANELPEFPKPAAVSGGMETIMIVEDEASLRLLSRKVLERQGYRVIEAESGPDALFMWEKHRDRVDLLLTDMVMPGGLSGFELAEKLRAEKPELKVIYNSGYTDDMLGENSPLRDNANFIEKPFAPDKLLRHVRDCLDGVTVG